MNDDKAVLAFRRRHHERKRALWRAQVEQLDALRVPMPDCLDEYGYGTLWEIQYGEEHIRLTPDAHLAFTIDREGWTLNGEPLDPGRHEWRGTEPATLSLARRLEHYEDPKPTLMFHHLET